MGKKQSIQEAKRRLSESLKTMPTKKIAKQSGKAKSDILPKPSSGRGASTKYAEADTRIKKSSKGKNRDSAEFSRPSKKSKHEPVVPDNGNYPEASKDKRGQKAPFAKLASTVHEPTSDSTQIGEELFRMLIAPVTLEEFFQTYYEKKPLHVSRDNMSYYRDWMSIGNVRALVDSGTLEWSTEVSAPRSTHRNIACPASAPIPSPPHVCHPISAHRARHRSHLYSRTGRSSLQDIKLHTDSANLGSHAQVGRPVAAAAAESLSTIAIHGAGRRGGPAAAARRRWT